MTHELRNHRHPLPRQHHAAVDPAAAQPGQHAPAAGLDRPQEPGLLGFRCERRSACEPAGFGVAEPSLSRHHQHPAADPARAVDHSVGDHRLRTEVQRAVAGRRLQPFALRHPDAGQGLPAAAQRFPKHLGRQRLPVLWQPRDHRAGQLQRSAEPRVAQPSRQSAGAGGLLRRNDTVRAAKIDSNMTICYGITADNPAFENIIRVANYLANLPPGSPSSSNPADIAAVNQAATLLNQGITGLQTLQGRVALQSSQAQQVQTNLQGFINLAQRNITNLESVDPATAITELNQVETNLQASYQTVSTLQQLSLVNYLK